MRAFRYEYAAGPFESEQELGKAWGTGNCRRAIQLYMYESCGIFLPPQHILLPEAYHRTGSFVFDNGSIDFEKLLPSDIIYAERLRGANGQAVDTSERTFATQDEYIRNLHSALWHGESAQEIWHATAIEGGSCFWPLQKFLYFYKPVAVKRVVVA